jgi:hypothetical protein
MSVDEKMSVGSDGMRDVKTVFLPTYKTSPDADARLV